MKQTIILTAKQRANYANLLRAAQEAQTTFIVYRAALLDQIPDAPAQVTIGELTDGGLDVSWPDPVPETASNA